MMYRQTSLGIALKETLKEQKIDEETQQQIWDQFDKIFEKQLSEHQIKGSISGQLQQYRNIECQESFITSSNEEAKTSKQKRMRLSLVVKDPKISLDNTSNINLANPYLKIYAIGEQQNGNKKAEQKARTANQGRKKKY